VLVLGCPAGHLASPPDASSDPLAHAHSAMALADVMGASFPTTLKANTSASAFNLSTVLMLPNARTCAIMDLSRPATRPTPWPEHNRQYLYILHQAASQHLLRNSSGSKGGSASVDHSASKSPVPSE
jgi:hypothetical protein